MNYLEYKKQAIEKLNDLVCSVEPSMNLYNRVSSLLSKDSRKFFDLFFYLCDEGLLEMDTIFADIGLVTEPRTAYSKSSSFEFLENPNIKFVTDDILTHEFKTPIDYMYLSNIFRFMHYNCWGIESQIRDNLDGKLSEDGKLMLHYQVLGAKPIEILTKDFPGHFSIPCLGMYPSDPEKAYIYSKKAKQ